MQETELRRLHQRRTLLLKRMSSIRDFARGSVFQMKRPCTYPRCRKCASGQGHRSWVLTFSDKGKTRSVYLGAGLVPQARNMVDNYRRLASLIQQVADINLVLLTERPLRKKGQSNAAQSQGP